MNVSLSVSHKHNTRRRSNQRRACSTPCAPDRKEEARQCSSLSRIARADLYWFFDDAEGDLGLQSNYLAMVRAIAMGIGSQGRDPDASTSLGDLFEPPQHSPSRAQAAERYRRIQEELAGLTTTTRRILAQVYGPRRWPRVAVLGRAASIATLTPTARRSLQEERASALEALGSVAQEAPSGARLIVRTIHDDERLTLINRARPELASAASWLSALAHRAENAPTGLTSKETTTLAAICAEAEQMLAQAERAYMLAKETAKNESKSR